MEAKTKLRLLFFVYVNVLLTQIKGKIIRHGHDFDALFTLVSSSMKLYESKYIIRNYNAIDLYKCVEHCVREEKCESINYNEQEKLCEILNCSTSATEERLRFLKGWTHYETDPNAKNIGPYCQTVQPCNNTHICEDTFERPPYICQCQEDFSGDRCDNFTGPGKFESLPAASCHLLSRRYKSLPNDFYWIKVRETIVKRVFCIIRSKYVLGKRKESAIKSCEWLFYNSPNFQTGFYWTWNKFENDTEFQLCDEEFEKYRSVLSGNRSLLIDAPENVTKYNMISSLFKMGKEYRVRFELKVNRKSSDLGNIIQFITADENDKHGTKYPLVFYKEPTIYIYSSVVSKESYRYHYNILDLLGKWITIDISQIKDKSNKFIYMIKINGDKAHEVINTSPREFLNVNVFAGNPRIKPANAVIRNLQLYGDFEEVKRCVLISSSQNVVKNNMITTLKLMSMVYRVRFEMKLNILPWDWLNVIHFTIGNDYGRPGDRHPAVFLGMSKLRIQSSFNNKLRTDDFIAPEVGKWISIDISQIKDIENRYVYSIIINGVKVISAFNVSPREFSNVKVYAQDPWYSAGDTLIRNLQLYGNDC